MAAASSVDECVGIKDFELLAEKLLSPQVLAYVNTGSMDEQTAKENCTAFKKWRFQPRCLRDVSNVSLKCSILGKDFNFPIGVSPVGQVGQMSIDSESGVAKVAANLGTIYTQSIHSSDTIEDIASASPNGVKWFQIQFFLGRDVTKSLIERAEKSGNDALVLTVDLAVPGKRYRLLRSNNVLALKSGNFDDLTSEWRSISETFREFSQSCGTWEDFMWLKNLTRLPIIIKGILTPQDALEALDHGAQAIWVSNHGGRQLDGVLPTIYALPAIAKAVKGRCPILFDGGVRNGADVAKAIALGADYVFVGSPIAWGSAVGGAKGAEKVLRILRDELELTMKLLGVSSVHELQSTSGLVVHESKIIAAFNE